MQTFLTWIYRISGGAAALSLASIGVIVMAQVLLNLADALWGAATGRSIGLLIPSYATFAGYALAFATFLSLGLAIRNGAHIRVTLLEQRFPRPLARITSVLIPLLGSVLGLMLTWNIGEMAYDARRFGDTSSGLIAVPLWLPQLVLLLGSAVFAIACLHTLVETLLTGRSDALEDTAGKEQFYD